MIEKKEEKENNFEWLKNNVKLFIDENIGLTICQILKKEGFKYIYNVYSIGHKSANDGKLLKILQKNRWILMTHDKKFVKMANKYDVIAFKLFSHNHTGQSYSPRHIYADIVNILFINYKKIKADVEKHVIGVKND